MILDSNVRNSKFLCCLFYNQYFTCATHRKRCGKWKRCQKRYGISNDLFTSGVWRNRQLVKQRHSWAIPFTVCRSRQVDDDACCCLAACQLLNISPDLVNKISKFTKTRTTVCKTWQTRASFDALWRGDAVFTPWDTEKWYYSRKSKRVQNLLYIE